MKYYIPLTDAIVDDPANYSLVVPLSLERGHGHNTALKDGVQFAWDSTSIGLFKACPRKYKLSIIDGWSAHSMPPPLAFGIHFHTCMQTWHQIISAGMDKDTALLRLVRLAGLLGETLPIGDTARTKETLVRSVVWYIEQFWDDPTETVSLSNGNPAVEYSFTLPFFQYKNLDVYICGHIDRLVKWQGSVYVCDYKTSKYTLDKNFFAKFKPSTQMALYTAACNVIATETQDLPPANGVIIDGIQLGVNFNRYARSVVTYSPEEIEEYLHALQYWIKAAMDAGEAGYFPANESACDQYGGCFFRDICSLPPARREAYLKGKCIKTTWDPLSAR